MTATGAAWSILRPCTGPTATPSGWTSPARARMAGGAGRRRAWPTTPRRPRPSLHPGSGDPTPAFDARPIWRGEQDMDKLISGLTRRDALKAGAVLAGAVAAPGVLRAQAA